jgi:hypothetical protein
VISLLTQKISSAIITSVIIILCLVLVRGDFNALYLLKVTLFFIQSIILSLLCKRYSILSVNTHLPLVLASTFSVFIITDISFNHLMFGGLFLIAMLLAYEPKLIAAVSSSYMIYFGVILGIAQAISNTSVLLIIPVFILARQAGSHRTRHYILAITYLLMVLICYAGMLYVIELPHQIAQLTPQLSLGWSSLDFNLLSLAGPLVIILTLIHLLKLRSYNFRYPNKLIITNYMMLLQLIIPLIIIAFNANTAILPYSLMALAVMLSFAFAYKDTSRVVNAAFASLIVICIGSFAALHILIL